MSMSRILRRAPYRHLKSPRSFLSTSTQLPATRAYFFAPGSSRAHDSHPTLSISPLMTSYYADAPARVLYDLLMQRPCLALSRSVGRCAVSDDMRRDSCYLDRLHILEKQEEVCVTPDFLRTVQSSTPRNLKTYRAHDFTTSGA